MTRLITIPRISVEDLQQRQYWPLLGNYLCVLSAADAALSRDARMCQVPPTQIIPDVVALALETAARTAFMLTQMAPVTIDPKDLSGAMLQAALRVEAEFSRPALIVPDGIPHPSERN